MSQRKQYYTVYKDKDWEMLPQIHQGVMNSWHILKRFLKEDKIVKYYNGWNTLLLKPQRKMRGEWNNKNKEAKVASTRRLQANQPPQEGKKKKRKARKKPYFPSYRIPRIQKHAMQNVFNIARVLMELNNREEQRMRQSYFQKEIALSPYVLNTL
ncbi:hypothetical protein O181_031591 [Austropuccinia psidii MF-1]|uniref:Uncharacterized protein n=1 Tax=Austropuccinia psidii MF-1 TaxID=1389203 RepID=A0A9Q3H5C3_9BASI|nr:hypothetical protein [Austropuccinia psidii MF-1]